MTKQEIIAAASTRHAAYPQYKGHWDGPEWRLAQIKRRIRSKMGVAFEKNDLTIARPCDIAQFAKNCVDAYSLRTNINCIIEQEYVEYLE